MTGDVPLTTVAEVLATVVAQGDRSTWPTTFVGECCGSLGAAGVGLAVVDAAGPVGVVAATPGAGRAGEDLQFALGEGPCRVAARTRRTVHVPDLDGDGRWVQFGRAATEVGIRAASSVPLQVGAVLVGVLDVYRDTPGPLTARSAQLLSVHGQVATAVMLLLADVDETLGDAAVLTELADIRPVVHQAAGMVAVQLGVDLTVALLRLRARAFGTGQPLRELAADVVARRVWFGDPPLDPVLGGGAPPPDSDPTGSTNGEQRNPDEHP